MSRLPLLSARARRQVRRGDASETPCFAAPCVCGRLVPWRAQRMCGGSCRVIRVRQDGRRGGRLCPRSENCLQNASRTAAIRQSRRTARTADAAIPCYCRADITQSRRQQASRPFGPLATSVYHFPGCHSCQRLLCSIGRRTPRCGGHRREGTTRLSAVQMHVDFIQRELRGRRHVRHSVRVLESS